MHEFFIGVSYLNKLTDTPLCIWWRRGAWWAWGGAHDYLKRLQGLDGQCIPWPQLLPEQKLIWQRGERRVDYADAGFRTVCPDVASLVCYLCYLCKRGLSFKIKKIHIHLYFIATQYLWNYALVEDIDNWTRSYILLIINWNRQQ